MGDMCAVCSTKGNQRFQKKNKSSVTPSSQGLLVIFVVVVFTDFFFFLISLSQNEKPHSDFLHLSTTPSVNFDPR